MSLYQKYRPQTFADVAGQDHIVQTLSQAVEQDKLSHAYLFSGTRGTGKTSVARILAKTLLTRGIKDATLKKQIIKAVEEGNLVDLTEIDAASNTGVDNIRDLIEKIQYSPLIAGAKVYIIDEVHMLSKGAFNALLKTLEEPPAYAYFILATTELHKIPATIQSRCQRFLFRQISEEDIVKRLHYIAEEEKITAGDDALFAIAHHAQGGLRDAISLLDQLRSLEKITLVDVKERIGETGFEFVEHIMSALNTGDRDAILKVVRGLEETGVPMENFVRLLLDAFRKDLHAAVRTNTDTIALVRSLDTLLKTAKELRIAPVPGLVLEAALLTLCDAATPTKRPAPAIQHIAPPSAPVKTPEEPRAEKQQIPAAPPPPVAIQTSAGPLSIEDIRTDWPEIVSEMEPAAARMSLKNGVLHAVADNIVTLRFSSTYHRDKVAAQEHAHKLEELIMNRTGKQVRVKCVLESDVHSPAPLPDSESVDLAAAAMDVF